MALLPLARSLRITHQTQLLLSRLLCQSHITNFSLAFHQTLPIPCPPLPHFNFQSYFSTRITHDPFRFIPPAITRHPHEPVLLESLKRVVEMELEAEAMATMDESGVKANADLVCSLIWNLKQEWRVAYLAFKWGEKWNCVDEKVFILMVWVLGNCKKFNIGWCLIRDMYRSSINTTRAMLVMIDRYAAANDPSKAINTFHIMDKFRITPDEEAYLSLLNSLCEYGYIEEAEEFMLVNRKLFPLETKGFNIILNGWSTICVDVYEAKRIWREMSKCCISPDATSYTLMISCFSKVGNLFDSLRLYDEMKKRGWFPRLEVYNSLIYVLTRESCFEKALKMVEKIKENGLQPDSTTYNSMILPLCEAEKLEEARNVLTTMIDENIHPTIETYHAFLDGAGFEGTLEVLNRMKISGLCPTGDTFLLILRKLFKLKQSENALKIWVEMKKYEVVPNQTHYTVLVEGLASCGLKSKAREFLAEMTSKGFIDDPKLKKLLKEPVKGNKDKHMQRVKKVKRDKKVSIHNGSKIQQSRTRKQARKSKAVCKDSNTKN